MKLYEIRASGYCCLAHIVEQTDSVNHTFAILVCNGCDSKLFCRKLTGFVEKELNKTTIGDRLIEVGSSFKR